jgi:hypothetical protein
MISSSNSAFTKVGTKGSDVYTADGVGDPRVVLNTLLVRDVSEETVNQYMEQICNRAKTDAQVLEDLWVMLFQNRDVRGGKGERTSTELMWKFLIERDKGSFIAHMMQLVPEYGCWRDLFHLADTHNYKWVKEIVAKMAMNQLMKDHEAIQNAVPGQVPKVSLVAKWIPREDRQPELAKMIAKHLFSNVSYIGTRLKLYRKMVTAVNKHLDTVEVKMCGKEFRNINPEHVPGRALKKYTKAFLNETVEKYPHGSVYRPTYRHRIRHLDDPDRMECREHFQQFFEDAVKGKVTAKAKNVVYPHELIKDIVGQHGWGETTLDQQNAVVAQWNALVKAAKEAGGLGRSLAMCDFSGSMQSSGRTGDLPYYVSMAMGLLISEVTSPEFKDTFITFDSNPILHRMDAKADIIQRVRELVGSGIGQGTSTDFQKAMDLVLQNIKANRVRPGQEPDNLIVITDMNWDQACGSDRSSIYTGHSYRHAVKTAQWQTHIQMIREAFKRAGEDMWGVPFVPPRIVIWNVAATSDDFHAQADTEGVVMVSGWSPSLFKNLLKGDIRKTTPMEMLRIILDDERYDLVRSHLKKPMVSLKEATWSFTDCY